MGSSVKLAKALLWRLDVRRFRRFYYDVFSRVYDRVIALHSADRAGRLRAWLVEKAGVEPGMKVMDLCTGKGSVALEASKVVGDEGLVVGVDFSQGMLEKAREKAGQGSGLVWVEASAPFLPFKDETFDVVLCSHAFYELKDWEKMWTLAEVKRVLVPGGRFCMMEHEEPGNPLVKFLYKMRLASMGSWDSARFVAQEMELLGKFFRGVTKEKSPTGNSKLLVGVKR